MKDQYLVLPDTEYGKKLKSFEQGLEEKPKQNTLYKLFKPLIEKDSNPLISDDNLSKLADRFGDFFNLRCSPDALYNRGIQLQAGDLTPAKEKIYDKRPSLGKQLGILTIDALSKLLPTQGKKFQGIKLDQALKDMHGVASKGLFRPNNNDININYGDEARQDVLTTIVHEGNHAIEHANPRMRNTLNNFLQKVNNDNNGIIPNNYPEKLYKGIQDIINLPREFTNIYPADKLPKNVDLTKKYQFSNQFEEIPAFALESLMKPEHKWAIGQQTNQDSRKLLRRTMKDIRDQYMDYGLVDKNKKVGGFEDYKYNRNPVPKYEVPNKYSTVNEALVGKIEELRKPEHLRKEVRQQPGNAGLGYNPLQGNQFQQGYNQQNQQQEQFPQGLLGNIHKKQRLNNSEGKNIYNWNAGDYQQPGQANYNNQQRYGQANQQPPYLRVPGIQQIYNQEYDQQPNQQRQGLQQQQRDQNFARGGYVTRTRHEISPAEMAYKEYIAWLNNR